MSAGWFSSFIFHVGFVPTCGRNLDQTELLFLKQSSFLFQYWSLEKPSDFGDITSHTLQTPPAHSGSCWWSEGRPASTGSSGRGRGWFCPSGCTPSAAWRPSGPPGPDGSPRRRCCFLEERQTENETRFWINLFCLSAHFSSSQTSSFPLRLQDVAVWIRQGHLHRVVPLWSLQINSC